MLTAISTTSAFIGSPPNYGFWGSAPQFGERCVNIGTNVKQMLQWVDNAGIRSGMEEIIAQTFYESKNSWNFLRLEGVGWKIF
jgi:hypothetical protein